MINLYIIYIDVFSSHHWVLDNDEKDRKYIKS